MSSDTLVPIASGLSNLALSSNPVSTNPSSTPNQSDISTTATQIDATQLHSANLNFNPKLIQTLPEVKFTPAKAFIGEPFYSSVEIPESLQLRNPEIILLSPPLDPINITKTKLVELQTDSTENSITKLNIRSFKPIPATTAFNFPVIITEAGKPVAKSMIEIGTRKLKAEEQNFMKQIGDNFAQGKSFTTTYPSGSAQPTIKIQYNKAPQSGKIAAALQALWKMLTTGKGTNPIEDLLNTENKSPEQRHKERDAATDYLNIEILNSNGKMKSRFNAWGDYLGMPNRWGAGIILKAWDDGYDSGSIGGGAGPIFNSAAEFATFALNNFAFAEQENFAPQFTAQKPRPSMSKERENRAPLKVPAGTSVNMAA